ncbi:hypothetical protein V7157_20180 [Neobacillus drentensis]|uniref:hypothetical protein n=1 Tax=Neobacillus drentensis TaxID=220684 RepID=UPI003003385A
MNLIIKSMSPETMKLAQAARDFLEAVSGETVILVPQGVKKIYILLEEQDYHCSVSLCGDTTELALIEGFLNYNYAAMYADAVESETGLTNKILVTARQTYERMKHKK